MQHTLLFLVCALVASTLALNPIVFFPGYALVKIDVTISGADIPGCPASGSFRVVYQYTEADLNGIPGECVPKYLQLRHSNGKVYNQQGVTLSIDGWEIGDTSSMHPLFSDLFAYLTARGYTQGTSTSTIRAVGYDWRTLPNLDVTNGGLDNPGFMKITDGVIKSAYAAAGNEKVYLIGHSNGPIMHHYFLTQQSQSYRDKYIAGSITLSGNFAGQALGAIAPILGFTPQDFTLQPTWTSALQSFPSTYMSTAQPDIFDGSNEVTIVRLGNGRTYTTQDYDKLYEDAGASFARQHWRDWIEVVSPYTKPYGGGVPMFSFYGGRLDTVVGINVNSFPINEFDGSNTDNYMFLPGDGNQEFIDNESVLLWEQLMPSGCFDYQEIVNVDHFSLCENPDVIQKIYSIVSAPVSTTDCYRDSNYSNSNTNSNTSNNNNSSSDSSSLMVCAVTLLLTLLVAI